MLYKKKDITFCRFGGLSPVKQKGNYEKDTFHSAPARKGFYAFVDFRIETFLLGGYNNPGTKHSKKVYIKDKDGNKVIVGRYYKDSLDIDGDKGYMVYDYEWDNDYEAYEKRYSKQKMLYLTTYLNEKTGHVYLVTMKKPKKFKYTGEIWHHFDDQTPANEVLKRKKGWILTTFDTYVKALNKKIHDDSSYQHTWAWDKDYEPSLFTNISYDEYEVFIERL